MISDDAGPSEDNDEILNRADTLLNRHRAATAERPAIPVLNDRVGSAAADAAAIPTLTDMIDMIKPAATPEAAPENEVISPVQVQNLEHSVYQKLRRQLDDEIAGTLQEKFMPEIAAALDQALHKVSADLKANIDAMVRTSIADALRERHTTGPSTTPGIMRDSSDPTEPK